MKDQSWKCVVPACQEKCWIEPKCIAQPKMETWGSLGTREWVTPEQSVIAAAGTTPEGWADLAVCLEVHTSTNTTVRWGDGSLWRSSLRKVRQNKRSCFLKYLENAGRQNGTTRSLSHEKGHCGWQDRGLISAQSGPASDGHVLVWGISAQTLHGFFLGRVFRMRLCNGKSGISLSDFSLGSNIHRTELPLMWRAISSFL